MACPAFIHLMVFDLRVENLYSNIVDPLCIFISLTAHDAMGGWGQKEKI